MSVNINADTTTGLELTSDTSGNINIQNDGTTVVAVTSSGAAVTGTLSATGGFSFDGANISTQPTFRNRIINGAMVIDQRNAGASVSVDNTERFVVDRFLIRSNATGLSATSQQSTTVPNNFVNSIIVSVTTGGTIAAATRGYIQQRIEGFNVADLGWGASGASTVTLSFWVRSSKTGTFSGALQNDPNLGNRSYVFTYSISSANTWEQKSITITGDTTGTWYKNNLTGISVMFDLGNGSDLRTATTGSWVAGDYRGANSSVNIFDTSGATFYITGVQLEVGSSATDFEQRLYGTELALCQRYYWQQIVNESGTRALGVGSYLTTAYIEWFAQFPVQMRAAPSIVSPTVVDGYEIYRNAGADSFNAILLGSSNKNTAFLYNNTQVSGTAGQAGSIYCKDTYASSLAFSAEL